MDELLKLRKIRGALRASVTKHINKLEQEFEELDTEPKLEQHLDFLTNMLKQINDLDSQIQALIVEEKDFDIEIESAIEYSQKISMWNSKLSAQIKSCRNTTEKNHRFDQDNLIQGNRNRSFENINTFESSNSNVRANYNIKLPKLTIEKYYGDPCVWLEFWNQFHNSIDKNESLSMIDKFSYLKSLLGGAAFNVVNGFALSEENYEKALKLLKQRFGREELVINAHMSKLLNLHPIKDTNNVVGLRKLYDTCEVQIRSLESLNVTSGMYGHLLYPILIKLIPDDLSLAFNRKRLDKDSQNEFDVMDLLNFLKIEIECRESVLFQNSKIERRKNFNNYNSIPKPQHGFTNSGNSRESPRDYSRSYNSPKFNKTVEYLAPISENICIFCKSTHNSEQCLSVNIDDKKEILRKQARCFLCLQKNHRIKDCKKKEFCDICHHKHNRALCYQLGKAGDKNETKVITATSHCQENNKSDSVVKYPQGIYLQTCTATIKSFKNEENLPVRILLDNGSMRTFVLRELSEKLKLPIVRTETLSVYAFGVDEAQEKIYDVVKIRLENRDQPSLKIDIEALVTDKISATNLPAPETNISKVYKQLKGLQLADSYEYNENKIVILIGSDFYFDVVTGRIKRLDSKLVAAETIFGWCIQGQGDFHNQLLSMKIIVEEKSISDQLREFWELENLGINVDSENKDSLEEEIMKKFEEGISYKDKRYKVKLPWKPEMKNALQNNKEVASRRFQTLKKSFINDPVYFSEYNKVLEDYRKENIIESVTEENEILSEDNCFYLPHRAVIREDKTTTRLRVVFDASSHSKGQLSLNDCLYTGLNLLPDLLLLLIRFRVYSIVVTADIKQAFLQIEIDEEDRNYTRFLWSKDLESSSPDEVFRMTRVLFGVTSSPFLLNATIKHHLKRYVEKFPHTHKLLENCLYVDDLHVGEDDVNKALTVCLESYEIFKDASMYLRKWRTNSPELFLKLKEQNLEVDDTPDSYDQTLVPSKVLGVAWNPNEDYFYFDTQSLEKFLSKCKGTKRYILQIAGRIFDPVGYIGPYTIRIKCLIQKIWCLGLDWDEIVPNEIVKTFKDWCDDLKKLSNIRIPRHYFSSALPKDIHNIQLHLFSDASIKAYGTVAYLRAKFNDGNIITSFVASKGRVAPLKTLSLPRLELMGALLSARLSEKIMKGLEFPVERVFWTDSSIVFFWIKGSPDKFKVFIKNRIQEIHKYTNPSEWFHCPGKENPGDLISRGLSVAELENSDFWWQGPKWLREEKSSWPKTTDIKNDLDKLEIRKVAVVSTTPIKENQDKNDLIERYSSFSKLVRISAWCLRFINNCKLKQSDRKKGYLSVGEIQCATKKLVKWVQKAEFTHEIICLIKKRSLPHNSKILSLNVFLDEEKILRVGGRLRNSNMPEFQKHQILLPKIHHFTQLLIDYYHKKSLHSGTQTTLYTIRQLYWIPSGQGQVRRVINKCMTCIRTKIQSLNQMMGDLPRDRVVPSRPFEKVGLDFAGPIVTKPNLKRSRVTLKSYIAIFICFCTKATHFEVVSDLTTESFLASLRRFVARRSKPSVIWSDNATNFKGAKNVLNSLLELCRSEEIQKFSTDEGIEWNFIPPASPHFGGLWEANIKCMKRILLKAVRSVVLNFEELTTLVTQIEAILNSRPLSSLSADPNDFQPLTPGHFLIGAPLLSIPEPNTASNLSFSSRWKIIQDIRAKFWQRWSKEYLTGLQRRSKWTEAKPNLKLGQLVLLKETNLSPLKWNLARIEKTFPGHDGLVRVIEVRTSQGSFKKTIDKVVPLPLPDDVGHLSNGGRDVPD